MEVPQNYRRLAGSERRSAPGARRIGPADENETLSVMPYVRRPADSPPLPDLAYWTATLSRRPFLSHEEFTQRYGAAPEDVDRVARFATSQDLQIVEADASRRTVIISGTVKQMSNAFAVDLGRYESPKQTYRGREGYIHVPSDIADVVEGVFGLDNRRVGEDDSQPTGDPNSTSRLTVPTITSLYSFPPGSAAPGAAIVVYFESPAQFGWIDFLTQAINNPAVSVISVSRRISINDDLQTIMTDGGFTQAGITQLEGLLQMAALKGVTIFMSCGDNGSEYNGSKHRVHWPASSPWVTACGGTTVGNVSGASAEEWVWNDTDIFNFLGSHATGGGISERYPVPLYQSLQSGLVNQASLNDGQFRRGVPDIAGNASPNSGYPLSVDGQTQFNGWQVAAWGTSIVSPLYAGLAALLNANLRHRIGFLNPYLYKLNGFGFRVVRDIGLAPGSPPDNGVGMSPGYPSHRWRVGPECHHTDQQPHELAVSHNQHVLRPSDGR